jgi:hypothetical protein
MTFAHFTNPLGATVSVKPDNVAEIRPAVAGVDTPGAKTVIVLASGGFQDVRESVAEVEEKLR